MMMPSLPCAALLMLALFSAASVAFNGDTLDGTGCPAAFRQKCKCGKQRYVYWKPDQDLFVVNCTNSGFTDTKMLEQLPSGTQVVIFNGNNVPILDWNIFGIWDEHDDLEVVDLSQNNIKEIAGQTFRKVGNVQRLVLDHNELVISGTNMHRRIFTNFYNLEALHLTNAFTETIDSKWYLRDLKDFFLTANMTKLRKLHLEQNEIWTIEDDDMFCTLPNLSELYLGDNQLQDIEFSLDCLKQLRYLDLEYNKIKLLSDKTLDKLDAAFADPWGKQIRLNGNPFQCDCNLKNFYDWLKTTNAPIWHRDDLRCFEGNPPQNIGRSVVNIEVLQCPDPSPSPTTTPSPTPTFSSSIDDFLIFVVHVLLVVLIVEVVGVAVLVVYKNSAKLRGCFKWPAAGFQRFRNIEEANVWERERQAKVPSVIEQEPCDKARF